MSHILFLAVFCILVCKKVPRNSLDFFWSLTREHLHLSHDLQLQNHYLQAVLSNLKHSCEVSSMNPSPLGSVCCYAIGFCTFTTSLQGQRPADCFYSDRSI